MTEKPFRLFVGRELWAEDLVDVDVSWFGVLKLIALFREDWIKRRTWRVRGGPAGIALFISER